METTTMQFVEAPANQIHRQTNAEMMKSISKARLARKAMADPSFAGELVKLEATGVYNAKGDVVQAVSTSLGQA